MTDLKIILYKYSIRERVLVSIVNLVAVDDAVLLQNRKFRLTCSILVSKCSARSN